MRGFTSSLALLLCSSSLAAPTCLPGLQLYYSVYQTPCTGGASCWARKSGGFVSGAVDGSAYGASSWYVQCLVGTPQLPGSPIASPTPLPSPTPAVASSGLRCAPRNQGTSGSIVPTSTLALPDPTSLTFRSSYGRSNIDSYLSWGASYELMGYLAKYRGTRNLRELAQFIVYAEMVFSMRDDVRGFAARSPIWSSTNYTRGVPYATVVGDGMITYPLADFAKLVLLEDPLLKSVAVPQLSNRTLGELARIYASRVEQTVLYHNKEWQSFGAYRALPETATYFLDSSGKSISAHGELPFNMSLALGRTHVALYQATCDPEYLSKAKLLSTRFKNWVTLDSSGYPYWVYWTRDAGTIEDVSHGAIDVDFMRLAYEAGIPGIYWRDLNQYASMFANRVYLGGGSVALSIFGGASSGDFRDSMSWAPLSTYDKNVKLIAIDASRRLPASFTSSGYGAWGYSMVAEFGGRSSIGSTCRLASDCESNLCVPSALSTLPDGRVSAISRCSSWVSKGGNCHFNKECASGLCLHPPNPAKVTVDLNSISGLEKVPLELSVGTCGSR